jgi:thiol-disulfide isomerase/thioredoxin
MSKAARLREQSARERIAAQQAAAKRAEMRRRGIFVGGSILAVIAVVVALIVVYANKSNTPQKVAGGVHGTVLPASVASDITSVPAATLNSVGAGSLGTSVVSQGAIVPISGSPPLTSGGKPEMLYIGAEYCPYCAATRWAMAVALSRFGTFTTPLKGFHSSSTDIDPNTATLTFYQQGYTSKYLTFTPVENEDINHNQLQPTTTAQQALWVKYDTTQTAQGPSQGYPFIDFGNKVAVKLPPYDPAVLKGLNWAQIASDLHNPSSPVAQAVLGSANYITAAICKTTGNSPASVCTSPAVTKITSAEPSI